MGTYVFDQAWQQERDRLRAVEDLFDHASTRRLANLGVGSGWRCLEVGRGAGGVALWLAEHVGCDGHVLATDLDPRFLAAARDFSRLTLAHLRERLMSAGLLNHEDVERFLELSAQPSAHYLPGFMVTTWGRRPCQG